MTLRAALLGLALAGWPIAASASQSFDGTVERFSHGQFVVRSFDDCKKRYLSTPPNASDAELHALESAIMFAVRQRRQNVHVVASDNDLWLLELRPSDKTGDADKKCVTTLSKSHVDGTVTSWDYGNGGASVTVRIAGGHEITFGWTYRVDDPVINRRIALTCDELHMHCRSNYPRVRVTYKTQVSGNGAELVPLIIDPL